MIKTTISTFTKVLCLLSFCLVISACGDDDLPADEQANDDLNGTWVSTSFKQSGTETLGLTFSAVNLTFTNNGATDGTFSAQTTTISGDNSTSSSTYEIVDAGARIKIGTDTLDMSIVSSTLNLEGNLFFAPGVNVEIVATKQ